MNPSTFQLFPYANKQYNSNKAVVEIENSIKNLNTRLLNLKKINKSLDEFKNSSTELSWKELKKIGTELNETNN